MGIERSFTFCSFCLTVTLHDFIFLPDGSLKFGCVDCFCTSHDREPPKPPQPPLPMYGPTAAKRKAAQNNWANAKLMAKNLSAWKRSGAPTRWVEQHGGQWNDADWLNLIADLMISNYRPIHPAAVGQVLEEAKRQYRSANAPG